MRDRGGLGSVMGVRTPRRDRLLDLIGARHIVQQLAQCVETVCWWMIVGVLVVAGGCRAAGDSGGAFLPGSRLPDADGVLVVEGAFSPLPHALDLDPRRVELGRQLFFDPQVSGGGDRSCADCHDLAAGGVNPGERKSNHPLNETGPYNVPTVFNVGFNFRYNWQGQFTSLESHLGGPMFSARVMDAGSWPDLEARLRPSYEDAFRAAGYAGVSEASIRDVLATYQRSLVTPDARFDRYLRGEAELAPLEARGLALFQEIGCVSCHQGINLGGNLFQRFGVVEDAFMRPVVQMDYGRMLITNDEADAHVFRVPSLRNVAITAPYFHDGSAATLDAAVRHMARVQLGYPLRDDEAAAIVAFLHTLTGTFEGQPLTSGVL